eukprot:492922-Pelagomonas_calceolata.AAC.1
MGREISDGIRGAMTGNGVNGVSYTLYADGSSLTTNDPVGRVPPAYFHVWRRGSSRKRAV